MSDAALQRGNLLAAQGQWAGAEAAYAAHLRRAPTSVVTAYNLGVARQELGRHADAAPVLARAAALQPGHANAHFALALSQQALGQVGAARQSLATARRLAPGNAAFVLEAARVEVKAGRPADAMALLDTAALADVPDALNLRGIALKALGQPDAALAAYDRALALRPGFTEARANRGNLRLLARQFSAALQDLDTALAAAPDADWQAGLRLYAALHLYDWTDFDIRLAALQAGLAQGRRVVQPLALQCLLDDPAAQARAARLWAAAQPPVQPALPARPREGERLRLAYVSRDFRAHPVSYLMAEVFELHDHSRFELIALNYGPMLLGDPLQGRARAAFDRFLDVQGQTDAEVVALARSLEIDIAVDLTGLTDGARAGLFAGRLAPLQLLYLGTLGTAGSAAYDYLVADRHLIPPDHRGALDERLLLLPCYQANDRQRPRPAEAPDRAALGLPAAAFVLCCFNNPCKITPAQFATWAEILRQLPGAVLWLLDEDPAAAAHLRAHAQAAGLAPGRLVFAARCGREAYLARLRAADLFLDTTPYNAGTTASDALWMGLPVLTCPGTSFAARVAASLLQAAGLPELIAPSPEAYIATAVRLARQPAALAALRERLQAGCALFDTPAFTRSLERGLAQAHHARLSGQPLADIEVR